MFCVFIFPQSPEETIYVLVNSLFIRNSFFFQLASIQIKENTWVLREDSKIHLRLCKSLKVCSWTESISSVPRDIQLWNRCFQFIYQNWIKKKNLDFKKWLLSPNTNILQARTETSTSADVVRSNAILEMFTAGRIFYQHLPRFSAADQLH